MLTPFRICKGGQLMIRPTLDNWIIQKISGPYPPHHQIKSEAALSRADLSQWQLSRINWTLKHASNNSSFYKSLFGTAQLQNLSDLSDLPFTTPEDLRGDPYRMVCVHPNEISRIVTLQTSGSTGESKRVFFTSADLELCTDFFHFGMQNLVNSKDIIGILFPYKTPMSVGDQLIRGLWRFGAETVPLFGMEEEEIASLIQFKKITSLSGMPNQIYNLAKKYPNLKSIQSVLLSADFVSDQVRTVIQDAWNAEVFEHYGMTEMGLGCGVSCEFQNGYHVREADLYLEIIDKDSGIPLPDGEWGEIVFTTLTRVGMPFIRYRTGDISRWKTENCSCGTTLKLLDYIQDRKIKKGNTNL